MMPHASQMAYWPPQQQQQQFAQPQSPQQGFPAVFTGGPPLGPFAFSAFGQQVPISNLQAAAMFYAQQQQQQQQPVQYYPTPQTAAQWQIRPPPPQPAQAMIQVRPQQVPQYQQVPVNHNKPPRSNGYNNPVGKQMTVPQQPHHQSLQAAAPVFQPQQPQPPPPPEMAPTAFVPAAEMYLQPEAGFVPTNMPPDCSVITYGPVQPQAPVIQRRERKPLAIIDPKTEKPINPNEQRNDSGYPSEASTPNSANCPSMPTTGAAAQIFPTNQQQDVASGTLTPASSTTDHVSPMQSEEAAENLAALGTVKEEIPTQKNDETAAVAAIIVQAGKSLSTADDDDDDNEKKDEEDNFSEEADAPIQMVLHNNEKSAPSSDVENQSVVPPSEPKQKAVNQFFNDLMVPLVRKSTQSPTPRAITPILQIENIENHLVESVKEQSLAENGGPVMKRNYSRSDLLGLKVNGTALPRNASIPKDIAIEVPPTKRLLKTRTPAEEICRELRSTLNKMTEENFDPMTRRIHELLSNDQDERMQKVDDKAQLFYDFVAIIFDKAISEPKLASTYAKMFTFLNVVQFTDKENKPHSFRRVMLNYCQREFEEHDHGTARQRELEKAMEKAVGDAERKDASENLQEFKNIQKSKYLGNIRLISELYKCGQLSFQIITGCVDRLLAEESDESLESLCKLLRDVGQQLENEIVSMKQSDKNLFMWWRTDCLGKLWKVVNDSSYKNKRICFFVRDILSARDNGWQFTASKT